MCPECGEPATDEDSEDGVNYYCCDNGHQWDDYDEEGY